MAAQSDVQICNLALDAIGARATIASLDEGSKEAAACARHFAQAVATILQTAHWNFARKQVSLTLLKDATQTPPDSVPVPWLYEYAYPSDCASGRYIMPLIAVQSADVPGSVQAAASVPNGMGPPVRWLVGLDTDSGGNPIKVILTNQPSAILVYTALIQDTGLWDDAFVEALYNYLASRIAITLSGDKTLARMAYQIAVDKTTQARASNGNEGITVIDTVPDWIRARGYESDWGAQPGSFFVNQPTALSLLT